MSTESSTNPAYRKVVAALDDCEERYETLVHSMSGSDHAKLGATVAALKNEVDSRRRLESELLTAVEAERQRIGQDLHDDLCQRLGATALLIGSLSTQIAKLDKTLGEKVAEIPKMLSDAIATCRNLARGLHPVTLALRRAPVCSARIGQQRAS